MPDLQERVVAGWLTELRPKGPQDEWPPAIRAIETEPSIRERLEALGDVLGGAALGDLQALSAALRAKPVGDELRVVLAQLGAARVLRLLHWFSETDLPECHAIIAGLLEGEGRAGQALRAAMEAVTRPAVLERIFAPERITALELACQAAFREAV
jgi:hypothetical protein